MNNGLTPREEASVLIATFEDEWISPRNRAVLRGAALWLIWAPICYWLGKFTLMVGRWMWNADSIATFSFGCLFVGLFLWGLINTSNKPSDTYAD